MYYSLYKDIKTILATAFGIELDLETGIVRNGTEELRDVQWFNNQYEGIIHTAPVVFIEFSDLDITDQTKQAKQTVIQFRLHVVTEVMDESDGDVADGDVWHHEALACKVLDALEDCKLHFEGHETRPLRAFRWAHHHKYNGFMVTLIDLKTKG